MKENDYFHIEMIAPRSWSCKPQDGEMVADFEAVASYDNRVTKNNIILSIPLHEDFFDFAKEYCRQYKIHIEAKLK